MAANINARPVLAAMAAVVLVAVGFMVLRSVPAMAEEDEALAHEWYFTITRELDEPHPFVSLTEATECIASMVQTDSGYRVPMSCSREGHIQFTADIDKKAGTARFEGEVWGLQIESEGALQIDDRACVQTAWSLVLPGGSISGTVEGCQRVAGRGNVRCPALQVGVVPRIPTGSKDARMVLLAGAGLPLGQEAGCWFRGDVNVDGSIDSRDAFLILQFEAGLIEHFPP